LGLVDGLAHAAPILPGFVFGLESNTSVLYI